jgi:hypothetical protein
MGTREQIQTLEALRGAFLNAHFSPRSFGPVGEEEVQNVYASARRRGEQRLEWIRKAAEDQVASGFDAPIHWLTMELASGPYVTRDSDGWSTVTLDVPDEGRLRDAIREVDANLIKLRAAPPVEPPKPAGGAAVPQTPKPAAGSTEEKPIAWLVTWRDILICLGKHDNEEDKTQVRRLNDTRDGPIKIGGKGQQPIVDKVRLLDWWNRLDAVEQCQNRVRDTQATAAARHNYGRKGEVAPDLGGEVKQRRQDRIP